MIGSYSPSGAMSGPAAIAVTLSDVRGTTLGIVCQPCAGRRRYAVARLVEEYGDAKLTDLLQMLADCPKARSPSIYDPGAARRFTAGPRRASA
jgi:hypothetical protein